MPRIAVVGGSRGATLHAEAVRATAQSELVGVGGRPGTATALAEAIGAPDRGLDELVQAADGLVVAVPPREVAGVVARIPASMPLLIESPVGAELDPDRPASMTAVNLLHAPLVTQGLAAIRELGSPHHLQLRVRTPRPSWGAHGSAPFGGVLLDPAATVWPVLLAAAARPVVEVSAHGTVVDGLAVTVDVTGRLDDGRRIAASLRWDDGSEASEAELEVAGPTGVVTIRLWPRPELEIDGRPRPANGGSPLVDLGFAGQSGRFASVIAGRAAPWPDLRVGVGVMAVAQAAARSLRADGAPVTLGDEPLVDPADWLRGPG